jgi:hypothetical protein
MVANIAWAIDKFIAFMRQRSILVNIQINYAPNPGEPYYRRCAGNGRRRAPA